MAATSSSRDSAIGRGTTRIWNATKSGSRASPSNASPSADLTSAWLSADRNWSMPKWCGSSIRTSWLRYWIERVSQW